MIGQIFEYNVTKATIAESYDAMVLDNRWWLHYIFSIFRNYDNFEYRIKMNFLRTILLSTIKLLRRLWKFLYQQGEQLIRKVKNDISVDKFG